MRLTGCPLLACQLPMIPDICLTVCSAVVSCSGALSMVGNLHFNPLHLICCRNPHPAAGCSQSSVSETATSPKSSPAALGICQSQSDDHGVTQEAEPNISQSLRSQKRNTTTRISAWPHICSRTNLAQVVTRLPLPQISTLETVSFTKAPPSVVLAPELARTWEKQSADTKFQPLLPCMCCDRAHLLISSDELQCDPQFFAVKATHMFCPSICCNSRADCAARA